MTKTYEVRVNQWVYDKLREAGLHVYNENDMPSNIKLPSKSGDGQGRIDFATFPGNQGSLIVLIENKYGLNKLVKESKSGKLAVDKKAVNDYAVNGVLYYAQELLRDESNGISEVIAVGVAGETNADGSLNIKNDWYYLYDSDQPAKYLQSDIQGFNQLTTSNYPEFYINSKLTDEEKHDASLKVYEDLKKAAKDLNDIFYKNSIGVQERVIYVAGMLLAMQDGLVSDDLVGRVSGTEMDSKKVTRAITNVLESRNIDHTKKHMMMQQFNTIEIDPSRDLPRVGNTKNDTTKSITKEIFDEIYYKVHIPVKDNQHLDTLGEMYSEFLKYSLSDGKELGIVLTPYYVTKLMSDLIEIDKDSKVLDLCTGSGGFLVTAMSLMLEKLDDYALRNNLTQEQKQAEQARIKQSLLGVEQDPKMFTLAATNMLLRGDGSSYILKDDTFNLTDVNKDILANFGANKALLNPPFSYTDNGMPFALKALDNMLPNNLAAIIIQDSAGTGRAINTNKEILTRHTLIASIKMPGDLFQPSAGVATSIYIFRSGQPHDFRGRVKFIDFRNDGYKRTGRGTREIDNPIQRYKDIVEVYKYGETISDIDIINGTINDAGNDWNYEQHVVYDTTPTPEDFQKTVGDYLEFQIKQIIEGRLTIDEVKARNKSKKD